MILYTLNRGGRMSKKEKHGSINEIFMNIGKKQEEIRYEKFQIDEFF